MQLKDNVDETILLTLGFKKIDKEIQDSWEHDYRLNFDYEYNLGAGRRGQYYSLFVVNREFHIYASEADGSGSPTKLDNIFIKLQNLVE